MKLLKTQRVIYIVFACLVSLSGSYSQAYFKETFLSLKEAKKKWGSIDFKAAEFIKATEQKKGAMAANLIEKNIYVNRPMSKVREEIGSPDSYFFSDTIYAYEITSPKENKEQWQLVFIPDDKLEYVKDIKIHKKCCYKSH